MRKPEAAERLRKSTKQWPPFGSVIKDVDVSTSNTDVYHGLGRRYHGFLVIKNDTNTDLKDVSHGRENEFVRLVAGSACTVTLWIL